MQELISFSGLMGVSVIRKTRSSGNIDQEQTCPDKRIITVCGFDRFPHITYSQILNNMHTTSLCLTRLKDEFANLIAKGNVSTGYNDLLIDDWQICKVCLVA